MTPEDQQALLKTARQAIEAGLARGQPDPSLDSPSAFLRAPGAAFVTLTRHGALRGCIGSLEPTRPLIEDVARNAYAAAFRDPRFAPMTRE